MAEVLATLEPRIKRLLDRRGLGDGDDDGSASDEWADEALVLREVVRSDDPPAGGTGAVS